MRKSLNSILLILAFLCNFAYASNDIAVVSYFEISKDEANEIFNFRTFTFSNGMKVKMFVLPRDNLTTHLFVTELGMTSSRFFEKADTAFSTGRLNLLKIVDTDKQLISEVSNTIGSIGYAKTFIAFNYNGLVYITKLR